jgi:hypothetical protein
MKPKDLSSLLDELSCAHNSEVQTIPPLRGRYDGLLVCPPT